MQNVAKENLIYVSVELVAKARNVGKRFIQQQCANGKYTCRFSSQKRGGNRGKSYEILLSSLPVEIQEKILTAHPELINQFYLPASRNTYLIPDVTDYPGRLCVQELSAPFSLNLFTSESGASKFGAHSCQPDSTISEYGRCMHLSDAQTPDSAGSAIPYSNPEKTKSSTPFSLITEKNQKDSFSLGAHTPLLAEKNTNNLNSAPFPCISCNTDAPGSLSMNPAHRTQSRQVPPIPEKAKNIALARVDLVRHWEAFRAGYKNKAAADKEFSQLYNSKALSVAIYSVLGKVSIKTVRRWAKLLKDGSNKYEALLPAYNYGGESELRTQMSEIERSMFLDIMLKNNNIKVGRAYEFVGYKLREQGIEAQSSISSYHRLWKFMSRNFYAETIFAREGEKAAKDKKLPSLKRDYKLLDVGDEIVADGHVLDFDLINPLSGKPKRLTLIAFQDCASRDILGWEIMPTENTQAIAAAFRNAVLRLGKMPKIVYLDNGRAFRGTYFTGCQSFCESGISGIYENLGVIVKFTQPYNGRSKIIERFFKEFTESLAVLQPYYVGNCIGNQPAYLKRNERFHRMLKEGKEVPTIEDFNEVFELWLENVYRKRPCQNNKSMTIGEYFEQGRGKGVNPELLDELIMASELRTVTKDGIRLFNTFYWDNALLSINDKVVVKYSLFDLSTIRVYSIKGEFICTAKTQVLVHPAAMELGTELDMATYKAALKEQKDAIKGKLNPVKAYLKAGLTTKKAKVKEIKTTAPKPQVREIKYSSLSCYDNIIPDERFRYGAL